MVRFNCEELRRNAGEPPLMDTPAENHDLKEIDTIPDASFVSFVSVRSTIVNGSLGLSISE